MNIKVALKPAESNAEPNSCDTECAFFIEPHTSSLHEKNYNFVRIKFKFISAMNKEHQIVDGRAFSDFSNDNVCKYMIKGPRPLK